MSNVFSQRLAVLDHAAPRAALARGLRGIEKESLRVGAQHGQFALTPHPAALGSALAHPSLTTDYSEALLELITPAEHDAALTLARLDELHRYVYAVLARQGEMLWNTSMPGLLPDTDEGIPIAEYGTSNIGRLKHVYRRGLALRYGRTMQCIAGIHYNYSLDEAVWRALYAAQPATLNPIDYQSGRYLALIRNFRRTSWLLMYLFGASPALDARFVRQHAHTLETFDAPGARTLYRPYATSLRMSDLGYSNATGQAALHADYDTLPGYLDALAQAVSQPYPPYEALGTQRDGEWVQINTNVLQIENEFYSTIRPKRVTRPGERPLHALAARGVQYIEVRCMDIDPFEPTGISLETARFLDAYLLACALDDSPPLPASANAEAGQNFDLATTEGRRPGLELTRDGQRISMQDWAAELFEKIDRTAALLDAARAGSGGDDGRDNGRNGSDRNGGDGRHDSERNGSDGHDSNRNGSNHNGSAVHGSNRNGGEHNGSDGHDSNRNNSDHNGSAVHDSERNDGHRRGSRDGEHARALAAQRAKLADVALTPSARVLQTMRERQQSFVQFGFEQSARHAQHFLAQPLDATTTQHFEALARQSLDEQAQLERSETSSFDAFIAAYRAYTLNRFSV